jgi:hypothetical protein
MLTGFEELDDEDSGEEKIDEPVLSTQNLD